MTGEPQRPGEGTTGREAATDGEDSTVGRRTAEASQPAAARAVEAIRDRADAVRDEQVERALAAIDEDLSPEERAEVRALADGIVRRLVAVPTARLRELDDADDEAVETALQLFGSERGDADGA